MKMFQIAYCKRLYACFFLVGMFLSVSVCSSVVASNFVSALQTEGLHAQYVHSLRSFVSSVFDRQDQAVKDGVVWDTIADVHKKVTALERLSSNPSAPSLFSCPDESAICQRVVQFLKEKKYQLTAFATRALQPRLHSKFLDAILRFDITAQYVRSLKHYIQLLKDRMLDQQQCEDLSKNMSFIRDFIRTLEMLDHQHDGGAFAAQEEYRVYRLLLSFLKAKVTELEQVSAFQIWCNNQGGWLARNYPRVRDGLLAAGTGAMMYGQSFPQSIAQVKSFWHDHVWPRLPRWFTSSNSSPNYQQGGADQRVTHVPYTAYTYDHHSSTALAPQDGSSAVSLPLDYSAPVSAPQPPGSSVGQAPSGFENQGQLAIPGQGSVSSRPPENLQATSRWVENHSGLYGTGTGAAVGAAVSRMLPSQYRSPTITAALAGIGGLFGYLSSSPLARGTARVLDFLSGGRSTQQSQSTGVVAPSLPVHALPARQENDEVALVPYSPENLEPDDEGIIEEDALAEHEDYADESDIDSEHQEPEQDELEQEEESQLERVYEGAKGAAVSLFSRTGNAAKAASAAVLDCTRNYVDRARDYVVSFWRQRFVDHAPVRERDSSPAQERRVQEVPQANEHEVGDATQDDVVDHRHVDEADGQGDLPESQEASREPELDDITTKAMMASRVEMHHWPAYRRKFARTRQGDIAQSNSEARASAATAFDDDHIREAMIASRVESRHWPANTSASPQGIRVGGVQLPQPTTNEPGRYERAKTAVVTLCSNTWHWVGSFWKSSRWFGGRA